MLISTMPTTTVEISKVKTTMAIVLCVYVYEYSRPFFIILALHNVT